MYYEQLTINMPIKISRIFRVRTTLGCCSNDGGCRGIVELLIIDVLSVDTLFCSSIFILILLLYAQENRLFGWLQTIAKEKKKQAVAFFMLL
jgi:hypothetical protein